MNTRGILVILFFSIFPLSGISQIVKWDLSGDSLPSYIASHCGASGFFPGSGLTSFTTGSTGAYAKSWTTNSLDSNDFFQCALSADSGYQITISQLSFSERRSLSGIHHYTVYYAYLPDFSDSVKLLDKALPDNDNERDTTLENLHLIVNQNDTIYFRWYGYQSESASGTWRINDHSLSIDGFIEQLNLNDLSSSISPATQPTNDTIGSTANDSTSATPVFAITVIDSGGDHLPTYLSQIQINNTFPTNSLNWDKDIKTCFLAWNDNTPIATDSIRIDSHSIRFYFDTSDCIIPDSSSKTIFLKLILNPSPLNDGTSFQCVIDSTDNGLKAFVCGSGFVDNLHQQLLSKLFYLNVQATELHWTEIPYSIWQDLPFSIGIEATDKNGNRDTSCHSTLTLSVANGDGTLSSSNGLSHTLQNGFLKWDNLQYSGNNSVRLKASDDAGILPSVVSKTIVVSVGDSSIFDDFSDDDLSSSPHWHGNTGAFAVIDDPDNADNRVLSLFTSTDNKDTSYLSTAVTPPNDILEWSLSLNLHFNPSDNNFAQFFLFSDNQNFADCQNGYFLQMGENGSADAIVLTKRTNGIDSVLLRTCDSLIADNPNINLKILFFPTSKKWLILTDTTHFLQFEKQDSTIDNAVFDFSRFFTGISCSYTSGNASNHFFFDNIYAGKMRIDSIAPIIETITVIDSLHLSVQLSEGILENITNDLSNFNINQGIGIPLSAQQETPTLLHLTLQHPLQSENYYILTIKNLEDFNHNKTASVQKQFFYFLPECNSIVINELMIDPTPSVELPEYEYIELFNNTPFSINLSGWQLFVNNSRYSFTNDTLASHDFLIITSPDGTSGLSEYGKTYALLKSNVLTNSSGTIILKNQSGKTISRVDYDKSWYKNEAKNDGGWSLERIDPNNICEGFENWTASENANGGTPGTVNSVKSDNPDLTPPELLRATLDNDTVVLFFSETMDSTSLSVAQHYSGNHSLGNPKKVIVSGDALSQVRLLFATPLDSNTIYTITTTKLTDCAGNLLEDGTCQIAIPQPVSPEDIIFNEILYHPLPDGVDFIELYNRSRKTINLKTLQIANQTDDSHFKNNYWLTTTGYLLFPNDFVVLTTNPSVVKEQYTTTHPKKFLTVQHLPSMPNDSGRLALLDKHLFIIDQMNYNDTMQFSLLTSSEGVSLERIDYDGSSLTPNKWHSAAQTVGFATPAYKNSQYNDFSTDDNKTVTLSSDIFSPDNDGYEDLLKIHFHLTTTDNIGTIYIFTLKGFLVRHLLTNQTLAGDATIVWDGLNDSRQKIRPGIYILFVEIYDLSGNIQHYKLPVTVAYRR